MALSRGYKLCKLTAMKRTFKFRVWEKAFKKMHEKVNLYSLNKTGIIDHVQVSDKQAMLSIGLHVELMEFTGREDVEGKEIFEGDIIKHGESIRFIEKRGSNFSATRMAKTETILLSFCESPKVIGNIYENNEFLQDVDA